MEELRFVNENGVTWVEGNPDAIVVSADDEGRSLIEACYYHEVDAVVLHAKNLPAAFFDLSSGLAGAILQKLRNYRIRLAIVDVKTSDTRFSSRFGEMLAEERQGRDFGLFESRAEALEWLRQD